MELPNFLFNTQENEDQEQIMKDFLETIREITFEYFSDKNMFSKDDFSFYYFDEFTLKTNIYTDTKATLYIEINQPRNTKTMMTSKKKTPYPELYFTLNNIREGLFEMCVEIFDKNTLFWLDKYGLNVCHNNIDEEGRRTIYNFRVIPVITHINDEGKKGVKYFNEKYQHLETWW